MTQSLEVRPCPWGRFLQKQWRAAFYSSPPASWASVHQNQSTGDSSRVCLSLWHCVECIFTSHTGRLWVKGDNCLYSKRKPGIWSHDVLSLRFQERSPWGKPCLCFYEKTLALNQAGGFQIHCQSRFSDSQPGPTSWILWTVHFLKAVFLCWNEF